MSPKQKIAAHFGVDISDLTFCRGYGWFYKVHFLHTSLYELQHTPAWKTKDISSLWIGDR